MPKAVKPCALYSLALQCVSASRNIFHLSPRSKIQVYLGQLQEPAPQIVIVNQAPPVPRQQQMPPPQLVVARPQSQQGGPPFRSQVNGDHECDLKITGSEGLRETSVAVLCCAQQHCVNDTK